jgi:hypothetical protein
MLSYLVRLARALRVAHMQQCVRAVTVGQHCCHTERYVAFDIPTGRFISGLAGKPATSHQGVSRARHHCVINSLRC